MDGPSLSHSHNLSSHSFSSHTSLYHIPANNPISNRGDPTPTKNHETKKKPPAQLTNTINIIKYHQISQSTLPALPKQQPSGGRTPYLHSTQTIKSSLILHLPTPPGRNTIILHQTSNAIFPHLDTYILEALHAYENPIEKGTLGLEVVLIGFAILYYCLQF